MNEESIETENGTEVNGEEIAVKGAIMVAGVRDHLAIAALDLRVATTSRTLIPAAVTTEQRSAKNDTLVEGHIEEMSEVSATESGVAVGVAIPDVMTTVEVVVGIETEIYSRIGFARHGEIETEIGTALVGLLEAGADESGREAQHHRPKKKSQPLT